MEQVQWLKMDPMDMVPWPVRESARTAAPVGRCTFELRPRSNLTFFWLFYTATQFAFADKAVKSCHLRFDVVYGWDAGRLVYAGVNYSGMSILLGCVSVDLYLRR